MEEEVFYSGYCRVLDASRTVAAEKENGVLTFGEIGRAHV